MTWVFNSLGRITTKCLGVHLSVLLLWRRRLCCLRRRGIKVKVCVLHLPPPFLWGKPNMTCHINNNIYYVLYDIYIYIYLVVCLFLSNKIYCMQKNSCQPRQFGILTKTRSKQLVVSIYYSRQDLDWKIIC